MGGAVKKVGKIVGKVFGFDADAAKAAAETQAAAIRESSNKQAIQAQQQLEAQQAQARLAQQAQQRDTAAQQALTEAERQAQEGLSSEVDVTLGAGGGDLPEDPVARRRRTRQQFQGGEGAGIRIS